MYLDLETKQSFEYLKKVVSFLDEPICILGGWAIYLTVNNQYKESLNKNYLGSRDIDLGFHLTEKDLLNSTFNLALKKLEKEGFHTTRSRLVKHLDRETGKELTQEGYRKKDLFDVTEMYVDLLVDFIPNDFKEKFGFNAIDETLLSFAFQNENNRIELKEFGKKLWLPKPELLLAAKIKSLPNRTKDHKRQKDICDIIALLTFSKINTNQVLKFISQKQILNSINQINEEEIQRTDQLLTLEKNTTKIMLTSFKKNINLEN